MDEQKTKLDEETKVEVRRATFDDREIFCRTWQRFMQDQADHGSTILPDPDNLLEFVRLFESYTLGSLFGFFLVGEDPTGKPVACLLGGEEPGATMRLKYSHGRCITLWGVWVDPDYRGKRLAGALQDRAVEEALRLGYKCAVSSVLIDYPAGESNAFNWGSAVKHATMIIIPLEEAHERQQRTIE
jgi:GNAT superfamily N-acetyltransferase